MLGIDPSLPTLTEISNNPEYLKKQNLLNDSRFLSQKLLTCSSDDSLDDNKTF